jgi:hypothetical protein
LRWLRSYILYGLARKSLWDVDADLKAGTLVEVLQKFSPGGTGCKLSILPPKISRNAYVS